MLLDRLPERAALPGCSMWREQLGSAYEIFDSIGARPKLPSAH